MAIKRYLGAVLNTCRRCIPAIVRLETLRRLERERAALNVLYAAAVSGQGAVQSPGVHGVIFSRDRALQLHALLRSFASHVAQPRPPLTVLYRATNARHAAAYQELFREVATLGLDIRPVPETPGRFRDQLLAVLAGASASQVFFLVDDMVFIRPVDFSAFRGLDGTRCIFSLRLGKQVVFSYPEQRDLALPTVTPGPIATTLTWRWRDGDGEWDYPLSVDGHVFASCEIQAMLRSVPFQAPNSLEWALVARFHPWVRLRAGVCYPEACVVNVPLNRVQHEMPNRAEDGSPDELLRLWEAGQMLDFGALARQTCRSAHFPVEARFVPRR